MQYYWLMFWMIVFPEGEEGNFKSSLKKYRLQPFHSGFARMAISSEVPTIPCLIVGAEEAHLNLGSINLDRFFKHVRVPFPLNAVPFPSKWKIRFLKPLSFPSYSHLRVSDRKSIIRFGEKTRREMQKELDLAIGRRGTSETA